MKAQIVSFHCVVKDRMGKVISSTYNHDVLTSDDGPAGRLKGLAEGLVDLKKGEKRRIIVPAKDAYGFYDPGQVKRCSLSRLELLEPSQRMELGDLVRFGDDDGRQVYRVTEIRGDQVTLDANHPLAGQDLVFEIEATAARDATPEEISLSGEKEEPPHLH